MFSQVLVAVDGSPAAEKALKHAIDLSKKYNAKLIILPVVLRRFYTVTPSEVGLLATTVFVKEDESEGRVVILRSEQIAKDAGVNYECIMLQGVLRNSEGCPREEGGSDPDREQRADGSVSDKVCHRTRLLLIVK